MKKTISIFSMLVLLFSNVLPAFTYAESGDNQLAIQILTEEVNNVGELFTSENGNNTELTQGNDNIGIFSKNSVNPYIVYDEVNGLITVYSEDFSYGITLQDRNLGAVNVGDYGNYYKWGNNDPIPNNSNDSSSIGDDNARGGENDNSTNSTNLRGYNTNNHKVTNENGRRGPCPKGYHIPSQGEASELIKLFYKSIGSGDILNIDDNGLYSIYDSNLTESKIANELKIPLAGYRNYWNNTFDSRGAAAYLWLSTPIFNLSVNNFGYYFTLGKVQTNTAGNGGRNSIRSIRCFKNDYIRYPKTVIYNPNGGAFSGMDVNETKEYTYQYSGTEIIPIYNIQIPDRISDNMSQQSGWMFDGWYTKDGANNDWGEEFDISNPQTNTAYAKWLPFNDLAVTLGDTTFIIMDRNLGAEGIASGTYYGYNVGHEDYNKFGSYYQWGNNYGFKIAQTINIGSELTENPNHNEFPWGPNNYYYNNKYIKRNSPPYRWDKENNKNLWGGEYYINSDNDKQGPCPKGYHVPDALEWNTVYTTFKNEQSTECIGDTKKIGECFANKLKLPYAGSLKTNDEYQYQGYNGGYWSSSNYHDDAGTYYLYFGAETVFPLHTCNRTTNNSVRCFKNNYNTLTFKVNGNIIKENNVRWREPVLSYMKPADPEKENSIFKGWYINGGDEKFEFSKSTYISGDVVLSPRFECKAGYKETDDGLGCERVRVDFDANSGVFFDGSKKLSVDISTIGVSQEITKTTHTPNFTDEGNFVTEYDTSVIYNESFGGKNMLFYEPAYIDTIGIEGAEELDITIRYGGTICGRNKAIEKYVRTGEHLEYSPLNGNIAFLSIKTGPSIEGEIGEINRVISGNAITIYKGYGCPDYGRYAIITGIVISEEGAYAEDAFDNIPSPILTGHSFKGWYTNEETVFDSGNVSTTEITKVYAKWEPNHYTIKFNKDGGTGNIEDIYATYGKEINLPTVTREGYTFRGWLSDAGVLYNNVVPEGTGVTTEDGVTVTLTAQWELIPAITPSAGGGQSITPTKSEEKSIEQEHNSADTEIPKNTTSNYTESSNSTVSENVKEQVVKVQERSLSRGEVAIMTNILLDVYPQLAEGRELNEVSEACENYADEQNFTKDEKKAITRLCKLSIMGIHADDNKPLEEFLVNDKSTNDEFSKIINRSLSTYTEKDFHVVKDALKKLEGDEENVVFGTVYEVFMSIKNIFN